MERKGLRYITFILFLILLSYPIVRSAVAGLFMDAVGAGQMPKALFFSVLILSVIVFIYDRSQKFMKVQGLFLATALFTFLFFFQCILLLNYSTFWAYPLYVWKEVYIILLFHLAFGYMNSSVSLKVAKILYGPIGAFLSIGGILGGVLVTPLINVLNVESVLLIGASILVVASIAFFQTDKFAVSQVDDTSSEEDQDVSPIVSIKSVKKYVALIAVVIIISQFSINIVNYKFNIMVDLLLSDKVEKAKYLGNIFAVVSALGLLFRLVVIPVGLKYFSLKKVHLFVPIIYIVASIIGFGIGSTVLLSVAISFIIFKGVDYSLFSTVKELLYFPLKKKQKYGAKYITDMVVYRASKGLISLFLIFCQNMIIINIVLAIILIGWIISLKLLFDERKKVFGAAIN